MYAHDKHIIFTEYEKYSKASRMCSNHMIQVYEQSFSNDSSCFSGKIRMAPNAATVSPPNMHVCNAGRRLLCLVISASIDKHSDDAECPLLHPPHSPLGRQTEPRKAHAHVIVSESGLSLSE
jgi:hypothetical protein